MRIMNILNIIFQEQIRIEFIGIEPQPLTDEILVSLENGAAHGLADCEKVEAVIQNEQQLVRSVAETVVNLYDHYALLIFQYAVQSQRDIIDQILAMRILLLNVLARVLVLLFHADKQRYLPLHLIDASL